ncbi:hypothetical protein [Spirosoma pollinicola]|uniref:Uncharacterized protein n=1 Tax=Spirosoma pollinicola TaxID=2057025 RepID=A0A2K8ZA37_9BACT|nr:hypothetical protein [Spirosoma pollinicola]AUD06741.1 hypothetical protein CWM47_35800 [Spirosoma pollinicola]
MPTTDQNPSYIFTLEIHADSRQAISTCLTDLLIKGQFEEVPNGATPTTGPAYEAFSQLIVLD